jgi:hypothetical protein
MITDKQGNVQASSDPARNDTRLDQGALTAATLVLSGKPREIREVRINGEPIREITVPYLSGLDNDIAGVIQVGLSDRVRSAAWRQGLFFAGGMVLLLLVIGIAVTRRISQRFGRPVIHLASDLAATVQAIPDLMFELDEEGRYLNVMSTRDKLLAAPRDFTNVAARGRATVLMALGAERLWPGDQPLVEERGGEKPPPRGSSRYHRQARRKNHNLLFTTCSPGCPIAVCCMTGCGRRSARANRAAGSQPQRHQGTSGRAAASFPTCR